MVTIIALLVGFVIGYFSKGITINVSQNGDIPEEYNPSYTDELPKEVREYVHERQTTGGDTW